MIKFNREAKGNITRNTPMWRVYTCSHGKSVYEVRKMEVHDGEKVIATINLTNVTDVYKGIEIPNLKMKRKHDFKEKVYMMKYDDDMILSSDKNVKLVVHKDMLDNFKIEGHKRRTNTGYEINVYAYFNGISESISSLRIDDLEDTKEYLIEQLQEIIHSIDSAETVEEAREKVQNIFIYSR